MDTSLEWKIVLAKDDLPPHGRRRRGRPQKSWRNQGTDFMRSRNKEEDIAFGNGWTAPGCTDPNNNNNNNNNNKFVSPSSFIFYVVGYVQ